MYPSRNVENMFTKGILWPRGALCCNGKLTAPASRRCCSSPRRESRGIRERGKSYLGRRCPAAPAAGSNYGAGSIFGFASFLTAHKNRSEAAYSTPLAVMGVTYDGAPRLTLASSFASRPAAITTRPFFVPR